MTKHNEVRAVARDPETGRVLVHMVLISKKSFELFDAEMDRVLTQHPAHLDTVEVLYSDEAGLLTLEQAKRLF